MAPKAKDTTKTENYDTKDEHDIRDEELRKYILERIEKSESLLSVKEIGTDYSYKHKMVWQNAVGFFILHMLALMGFYLFFTGGVGWKTFIWGIAVGYYSATMGITIGAHRCFSHRTFKAKPILKALFILGQTIAGQNCMFVWSRDHRLHHRYSDTDADPHNSKRGFFFCHIGWLMMRKHPYVIELGKRIDISDLKADKMVQFQKKYYYWLYFVFGFFIPVAVPVYFFGETWTKSFFFCYCFRYILTLNGTWLVNSAAHLYGTRPYDKNLQPVESWFVSWLTSGEGWHNYHHAFPWDYKAAELTKLFNLSATFIEFFERIGWAYDLKMADPEMVKNRITKTGDGTHYELGTDEARSYVTAFGPVHPFNPSYTTKFAAPKTLLKEEGLPLSEKEIIDENESLIRWRFPSGKKSSFT